MEVLEKLSSFVADCENGVVVFSKTYCPFCRQTKQLLADLGIAFCLFELDQT